MRKENCASSENLRAVSGEHGDHRSRLIVLVLLAGFGLGFLMMLSTGASWLDVDRQTQPPVSGDPGLATSSGLTLASTGLADFHALESSEPRQEKADASKPNSPSKFLSGLSDAQLSELIQGGQRAKDLQGLWKLKQPEWDQLMLGELQRRWSQQHGPTEAEASPTEKSTASQEVVAGEQAIDQQSPEKRSLDQAGTLSTDQRSAAANTETGVATTNDTPAEFVVQQVLTELVAGDPLNPGRIELTFQDGHGPVIYPDQSVVIQSQDERIFYVTTQLTYQETKDRGPYQVKKLGGWFLIKDEAPVTVEVSIADATLATETIDDLRDDRFRRRELYTEWWTRFAVFPKHGKGEQWDVRQSLYEILASRYHQPLPSLPSDKSGVSKNLEAQFERAIGMLFGIESVKLAMHDGTVLEQNDALQEANVALPSPVPMRSVFIPRFVKEVEVEELANHVPQECFYLRSKTVDEYQAFRQFLTGWGGSLDDIVSGGEWDFDLREKVERQLAFQTSRININSLDAAITDLALIGTDPFFQEGAAVGVLLEARPNGDLKKLLGRYRAALLKEDNTLTEKDIRQYGYFVSLLSSKDNRVRSFHAVDGRYHLITNSEHLVNRFFQAGKGERALGSLREFAYAKTKSKQQQQSDTFLYLSDPFFQNIVGPHYRIEMTRRQRAERELKQLQMAQLVASAEGQKDLSVSALVQNAYLSPQFGKRADESAPRIQNGQWCDSLRGAPGYFLPVPDVKITQVTRLEQAAYQSFVRDYNRQWRRVDPVTVTFDRQDIPGSDRSQVHLKIIVTPYARERYALLNRYLAAANRQELVTDKSDLLSIQAAASLGGGRRTHLLRMGIRDRDLTYEIHQGEVRLTGEFEGESLATALSYLAMTPPSTEMLQTIASVLLEGKAPSQVAMPTVSPTAPLPPLPTPVPFMGSSFVYFARALVEAPSAIGSARYLSWLKTEGGITVFAKDKELRQAILTEAKETNVREPHRVSLNMGSLEGTQVEPYLQAFTYMKARHVSYENSRLISDFSRWLNMPTGKTQQVVEAVWRGKLLCPLGGQWETQPEVAGDNLRSSQWLTPSLYQVKQIPADWRFPFLNWLQAMQLDFDMDQSTLTANIVLEVRTDSPAIAPQQKPVPQPKPETIAHPNDRSEAGHGPTIAPGETASHFPLLDVKVKELDGYLEILEVGDQGVGKQVELKVADQLVEMNTQKLKSATDIESAVENARRENRIELHLLRRGAQVRLRIPLD